MNALTDIARFNDLYNRYRTGFVRFAESYVRDREVAENLISDAFVYYWEHRADIASDENLPAYILTVVKHKCLNHLRREKLSSDITGRLRAFAEWDQATRIASLEACDPHYLFSQEIREIIERTTSGKGLVCEIDYDSIRRCVLRTGHNVKTSHRMPTLREALETCRDRIVVNVDQGYEYYDLVLALTEELGMTDQVLIKGKHPVAAVAEKFAEHPRNMMYMPIVDILKPQGRALFDEYRTTGTVPLAYEVCWDRLSPEVEACMREVVAQGSKLWVNSLWPSLCGGLDDDTALTTSCEEVYGRLVGLGATLIQTDRPELLLNYLRSRGLHD